MCTYFRIENIFLTIGSHPKTWKTEYTGGWRLVSTPLKEASDFLSVEWLYIIGFLICRMITPGWWALSFLLILNTGRTDISSIRKRVFWLAELSNNGNVCPWNSKFPVVRGIQFGLNAVDKKCRRREGQELGWPPKSFLAVRVRLLCDLSKLKDNVEEGIYL